MDIPELIREFRKVLTENYEPVSKETDAVVMHYSSPDYLLTEEKKTLENEARIDLSIHVVKQVTAERMEKKIDDIFPEDIIERGPFLVINSESEQFPFLQKIVEDRKFPKEKFFLQDCGKIGVGNTKTQSEAINDDSRCKDFKHLVLVTSAYHVPRVGKTAQKNLDDKRFTFEVRGVSLSLFPIDVFKKTREEIKRILKYQEKGDIAGPKEL